MMNIQAAKQTGLELNKEKTSVLISEESDAALFTARGLTPSTTFIRALGSIIRDGSLLSRWLVSKLKTTHQKLFDAITDKRMPIQAAFLILRMCAVPPTQYWIRTTPPPASADLPDTFDDTIM